MKLDKKKLLLSIAVAGLFLVAVLWLVVRACTAASPSGAKVYYIGRDSTWYPLDLRRKEMAMVGFTNDLVQAIAHDQDFRAILFEVGSNALFNGLNIGNYDAVLSSLPPNAINRTRYGFSDPFYLVGPVLVVRENSPVRSLEEMKGKILGIEGGALQIFSIVEPSDVVMIPYESGAKALENLDANIIDGVLMDALQAYVWTEGFYAGRLKVATSPLTNKGLRMVTRNSPPYLSWIEQFNAGLNNIKASGLYDQLLNKWDLINTEVEGSPPLDREEE